MNVNEINYDYEKELIHQESKQDFERKQQLLKEVIEATTYKKGETKKEVFKLPMPTDKSFLSSKNVNVKTYGALLLNSNWGGKFLNPSDRYIYKDKWNEVIKQVADDLKISDKTIKRHITKLEKCDIKAIELTKSNDQLIYRLNYGVMNEETYQLEKYVTITNVALRKLINAYSEYALRIYLFLLYKCYKGGKLIKQTEICEAVGLAEKSRKIVTDCVDALERGGFIEVSIDYNVTDRTNEEGITVEHTIPNYYYSLSEDYLVSKKLSNKK
ncbi:MAG: hypothetical protein ACRCXT_08140 [Paraclostridium sp.]